MPFILEHAFKTHIMTDSAATPMVTDVVPATGTAAAAPQGVTKVSFESVKISLLSDDGDKVDKYPGVCTVLAEYDPEGMLVKIVQEGGKVVQEFLVKKTIEAARVGRTAITFHLDVETLFFKFGDEERARKFSQMVNSIRYKYTSKTHRLRRSLWVHLHKIPYHFEPTWVF